MYVKIFKGIFDGSLYGQFDATVTFVAMLVLAEREGIVDMTSQAISAKCGFPIDIIERGIAELEKPDPLSRSPDDDGRRIVQLDPEIRSWGWRIVNYEKYEKIRSADERRAYFRTKRAEYRARDKKKTIDVEHSVNTVNSSTCSPSSPPNLNLKPQLHKISRRLATPMPAFHADVIAAYHEICKELPKVKIWTTPRAKALDARIAERLAAGKPADTVEYWRSYFEQVAASDFLCGRKGEFRADLEWLVKSANFAKVIEERYANHRSGNGGGAPAHG